MLAKTDKTSRAKSKRKRRRYAALSRNTASAARTLAILRQVHSEIADLDGAGEDESVTQAMEVVFRHIEDLDRVGIRRR